MKHLSVRQKQVIVLFILALFGSAAAIVHGIFFDLEFSQIKRLTLEGLILTVFIIFPALLFVEWVFDWNNNDKFARLENEVNELKKKIK